MITGPRKTVKLARKLRSEMSLPEVKLWQALRSRPGQHKFRRQHPAGPFVLDFYCAKAKLDIEVDGTAHDSSAATSRDQSRSQWLRQRGIATTRIPAKLVLEDLDAVVRRLVEICDERIMKLGSPLHHPADGPPPHAGEDV
ncbi:MAG: endonuclease domain-containing protein [Pseudomonadota bacterium]